MSSNSYEKLFATKQDVKPAAFALYTPSTQGEENAQKVEPIVFDGSALEVTAWQPPHWEDMKAQPEQAPVNEEIAAEEAAANQEELEEAVEADEFATEEPTEPVVDTEAMEAQHKMQLEKEKRLLSNSQSPKSDF